MKKAHLLSLFFGIIFLTNCEHHSSQTSSNPISNAYQQQFSWVQDQVRSHQKAIIGYKAGLTSKAGQQKFNVTEPVAGVLFKSGLSHNQHVYQLENYSKLMLETEIGFILKSDLSHSISQPNQLLKIIDKVVPVIELPDLAYPDMTKVTGIKLIETNVASNQVLIGKGKPLSDIDINSISTTLTKNGVLLIQGNANDAMGDQLTALQWLVNSLVTSGYSLNKGDLLITGALGKMIPAEKGQYDADFGELGHLAFSIR